MVLAPNLLTPGPPMLSIAELHPALRDLFGDTADHLARQTGFCRRQRKLTGPAFAQALVFALLRDPAATLDDFAELAADALGLEVTPQAFDKRFTPAAADFLHGLFLEAFNRSFESLRPALLPVLRRFAGVFLRDATLVGLPPELAGAWPGRGGRHAPHGRAAAAKLVLEAELTTGELTDVSVLPGLANERSAEVAGKPLPAGALLLEDTGFFSGERLKGYAEQGVYVLTRVPAWTAFFDEGGRRLDLAGELRRALGDCLELPVRILHGSKQRVRLLAVRLPGPEAEERRRRVRREAKRRGRAVSRKKLELCEWNVLVTNAPAGLLGAREAHAVRRVRWQVELAFRLFKSEGKIDQTRSRCPCRVLCELFAKLLAQVVQQWALLAAGYQALRHSARRAARRVRRRALRLLEGVGRVEVLAREVRRLAEALHRRCRVVRRRADPSTLDRLMAHDPEADELAKAA
jgi:DDE family transposase